MPAPMKTTLTRESASKVKLAIEATSDEVAPAIDRAVASLGKEVKIPGFRKGHVPRKVLETRLGRDAVREAALKEAIPSLLAQAVETESVAPIAPPSVEIMSYDLDGDLAFDATVEVRPEIELPSFELLTVKRPSTEATDEEVSDQIARLQDRFASLETVTRPARRGDYVLIDIHTTQHADEIKELSGTDQLYELGAGFPVPQLDEELEGKRTGDIVKFNAEVPERVGGPYAGQEVTFQALVKDVREKKLPALDDEFAKTASEFDTLDELRADLRARIEKVKGVQADADVRNLVLEQALDDVEIEAPESLVNDEMAFRLERFEQQLRQAGMTLDQYLQQGGATEEQIESDLRTQAERNVRAQLLLEEIARREGFQITEEELRDEVRYHAETLRTDAEELQKQLASRGRLMALAGDIIRRKALNYLVEKADVQQEGTSGSIAPETEPASETQS
jgi:trigger factor